MKKEIRIAMLLAFSIVLNILESFIPIFNIPGIRIGLANIPILVTLYIYGFKDALYVSTLKVFVVGILRTGLFSITFYFSLFGSIFSIISMYLIKKLDLSIIGVSIFGSFMHNIGQLIAAFIFINTNLLYYLPLLTILSILSGIIIGLISKEMIKILKLQNII